MMKVRKAADDDIQGIMELICEFHEESLYAYDFAIEKDTVLKTIGQIIKSNVAFVSEQAGRITGVVAGAIQSSIFDYREKVAYELFWYVSKPYRTSRTGMSLLKAFEQHCEKLGVSKIIMKHMENLNALDMNQLYERKKYRLMELEYIKDIKVAL
jgi:N-acetylglutamate synthase-like GNAT family acetyltransferase